MARDLFQEVGISSTGQGGRDLFAEAGIDVKPSRSVIDIVSGGIGAIADDVTAGRAAIRKRERDEAIARSNEASQAMIADQQASGTADELQHRADQIAASNAAKGGVFQSGVDLARDTGINLARGVADIGQAAAGLTAMPLDAIGALDPLAKAGADFRGASKGFDEFDKWAAGYLSDTGKAKEAKLGETKGFTDTLLTLGTDPRLMLQEITKSLPGTLMAGKVGEAAVGVYGSRFAAQAQAAGLTGDAAGQFIARAFAENANKITRAAMIGSAAGEGLQQTGGLAGKAQAANIGFKDYVGPAVASGVLDAAISLGSTKLANKIGIGDVESDVALRKANKALRDAGQAEIGAGKTAPAFWLNRGVVEGAKEGLFEEMPQSVQEAIAENLTFGRPWDQGIGKSAAQGLATGFGMGGGHAVISRPNQSGVDASPGGPSSSGAVDAGDVLGIPSAGPETGITGGAQQAATESDKALYTPKNLTALDRVNEIDAKLPTATPEESSALQTERDSITATWPQAVPGAETSFSTETGARLDGQYALMEAGDLTTSHDENLKPTATYPAELQPRERDRHASEIQIQGIVGKLDPARLGESGDVATGAPIVGADGLVESGNARTIALKRVYQANGMKAETYKAYLKDNADRFGITPESVDAMQKPVLVRVRQTPVNRAEFARQANASTVARMSPSEQAKSDAAQIDSLDDLNPDEAGDFMSGSSTPFVRRFLAKLAGTEQAGLIDASGRLSQTGYTRIRNAVLAKAYGDSPVLLRMVESLDDNTRNVSKALLRVAPQVAKAREAMGEGALHDVDLIPDLMAAVEELSDLKEKGVSIEQALAQASMFGDKLSPEARQLLVLLSENARSPRRIADFIQAYLDALTAAGNPGQGSMFGDNAAPAKADLITAAKGATSAEPTTRSADAGNQEDAGKGRGQSKDAQGDQAGHGGNEAAGGAAQGEWVAFPADSGTLGIPRAEMPQVKGEHRGALIQFLDGLGITHKTVEMPASKLKPTQAEFSTKKAEGWKERKDGSDRSVLASSDGYILDGHHQWVAALALGETEQVIQFSVPIKELLAATFRFPSVQQSEGSGNVVQLRTQARQDFKDALADLAQIATKHTRAAMLPENTPNLMPTLIKLSGAAIAEVGYQIKDIIAHVKQALRSNEEFKKFWNKIDNAIYRKAAEKAAAQQSMARVDNLFAAAAIPEPLSVDSYIKQNSEGVWKLSKPAPAAMLDAVIAEMDRRNQGDAENVPTKEAVTPEPGPEAPAAAAAVAQPKTAPAKDKQPETSASKTVAEASLGDLLRAAADKADGKVASEDGKPVATKEPAQGAEKVGAGEAANNGNTEDAGAELTYNKRNRLNRGLRWSDIADKEAALRVKEVTKAKVYPKPDYAALVDGGMNPVIAHLVKQIYDSIASSPVTSIAPTDEQLQIYISATNRVMDGVSSWAQNNAEYKSEFLPTAEGVKLLDALYPNGWRDSKAEIQLLGGNKFLGAIQPSYDERVKANKAIKKGWPGAREAFEVQGYRVLETAKAVSTTVMDDGKQTYLRVDGSYDKRFDSPEEAQAAIDKMRPWLLVDKRKSVVSDHESEADATDAAREKAKRSGKGGAIKDVGISVTAAERIGPARRMEGEDVTSDQLQETFGFKGVNFGTWMKGDANKAERQLHLNHAYDAMLDLAEILNVPPKAMSLNGLVGLAIGAQGSGAFAAAHFVPGVNEINLTRTSGAGSLAHEWAHGMDHYFARLGGLDRQSEPFLTEHTKKDASGELRPEIVAKFKAIVAAMNERKETQEEYAERQGKHVAKLEYNVAGWLKSIRRDFESDTIQKVTIEDGKARREKSLAKLDKLIVRINALDLGDGKISVSSKTAVSPAVMEIRELYKETFSRPMSLSNAQSLQANIDALLYAKSKQTADETHEPQTTKTDYAKNAAKLDDEKGGKRYWNTNLEKFARAFDAFVSDTLDERAAKNTYLSHAGRGGETVPAGTERETINQAFRELVATIETKETDSGVAMLSRADRTREAFAANALQELATEDALFRYPVSQSGSLKGIFHDVFPGVESFGESTRADETAETGAEQRFTFKTPDTPAKDGNPEVVGKQFEVYVTRDKVWIDVHRLQPGDQGSRVYAAVANFAYNTKRVFGGDPAGVSVDAIMARNKMMLASALRFGTTRHLEASAEQERGVPEGKIEPLGWSGNDIDKVRALIHTFITTVQNNAPAIKGSRYDFQLRRFVKDGSDVSGATESIAGISNPDRDPAFAAIGDAVGRDQRRAARIGADSGRAAILIQSLVSEEGRGIGDEGILQAILDHSGTLVGEGGLKGILSRGTGRGMALRDLNAVVDRVSKGFKNLPRVHVLSSPADLSTTDPTQKALRDFIKKQGAWDDVEGATHEGEIYLFASGLADEAKAEHVLATHEVTHYGLRGAIGKDLDAALQHVMIGNERVRKATVALKIKNGLASNLDAVEEVLADIPAAELVKLNGWRRVVKAVRNWLNRVGATSLAARLDKWLNAGLTEQQQADLFVTDLLTAARDWVKTGKGARGVASMGGTRLAEQKLSDDWAAQEKWLDREAKLRGFKSIDDLAEKNYKVFENLAALWRKQNPVEVALFSRAGPASPAPIRHSQTANRTADDIINKKAGTARPIDAVMKGITQFARIDRLTTAAYNKAGALLDRFTPETIKAGMVSDYGIPEAVTDMRAVVQGRQKQQTRAAGALLEKLATLTRAESRVAYQWMNSDDPQSSDYFIDQLPAESVKTLAEVEKMIDSLSKEAVALGQLAPDAYARNRFAYLHRSYVKHEAELTKGETAMRKRAISILGDQYKGRGMTDAAPMRQIQNIAPEWWGRKTVAGKADKGLKGEKFVRLERRAPVGAGTLALPGTGGKQVKPKLLEIAYWPASEPIPAKYGAWERAGTWEVRDTKGADLILWRDFTAQEREGLGEVDEVRYAIAKTLHGMIHDVETGKYLQWLAQNHAKKKGEAISGTIVEASDRMRDVFKPGEWVQVPETVIPGTQVKKYGALAGRYLPGPIWNDVRQVVGFRYQPLGETYAKIHRAWKTSKTALSPAVHMNNVMANFVMADWHDVTAGHILKALKLMLSKDAAAAEVIARFSDSGGSIGTWAAKELQQDQMRPIIEALEKELGLAGNAAGQVGVMSALQLVLKGQFPAAWEAAKPSKPGKATVAAARAMLDLYEAEDQVFRLAAWLRAKEGGASDLEAGKLARKSFLDYSINAPWVQMLRNTALPFVAFTYRAVPMMMETAAKKPWKLLKLGMLAGAINALGYMLSGGDEDDERKLLPEEKAGRVWGIVPKLIRMPWNDANGSPVFLDVRRYVPVGDVLDIGQSHAAVPLLPGMTPGGPLAVLAELAMDQAQFTGKAITLETDTPAEKAAKVADHLYKAFAPNIILLPGTYAFTGAMNAGTGKTDTFGREQSLAQAVVSSVGIKMASYPKDVLEDNEKRKARAQKGEIQKNISSLRRERDRNGISEDEFIEKKAAQRAKIRVIRDGLHKKTGEYDDSASD